jgi:hypothetical protein
MQAMNDLFNDLFVSEYYSKLTLSFYYLGVLGWLVAYILIIKKIIKDKFVGLPLFAIAANVSWELLWAYVFPLDFGGRTLLYAWRFGLLLDLFMLVSVLRYGRIQFTTQYMKDNYLFLGIIAFVISVMLNYTFSDSGHDLPMGFNSGMILNIITCIAAFQLFLNIPTEKFSVAVGVARTLATDVFLFTFLILAPASRFPDKRMSYVLCVVCLFIDIAYIVCVIKRNKQLDAAS